MTELITDRRRG